MSPIIPVPKRYLLLVSGLMWSAVGLMLIALATGWLQDLQFEPHWLIIVEGIIPGILVAVFGFTRIVQKNIQRIRAMDSQASVFAFQAWHSYVLIVIMMSMGIYVRQSGLIPMILKTPGYYTIGTALSVSSIKYYQAFIRNNSSG
ncbi:MAG: hypothetical protein L3J79_07085 [Candidatus Marinimicrobia bacterium]|nr:hypothetical protein [Candidatus Neomarinimicrobiota bacterium]